MVNEYQKIVLLKGLEPISAYHFSMVKSLLAHGLQLTAKPQDEYSKIEIAKLMAEKYRGATCVDKLIDLYKDIPELKSLVKNLRSEKLKGNEEELLTLALSALSSTLTRTLTYSVETSLSQFKIQ